MESNLQFNPEAFVFNTVRNVALGISKQTVHDIWINDDMSLYCLCRAEKDSDGELVYTAYQLWIDPKIRGLDKVRSLIEFIRFYAQKQGYKRMYIISSRLDHIKAYSRGIGKQFKVKGVTFSQEF